MIIKSEHLEIPDMFYFAFMIHNFALSILIFSPTDFMANKKATLSDNLALHNILSVNLNKISLHIIFCYLSRYCALLSTFIYFTIVLEQTKNDESSNICCEKVNTFLLDEIQKVFCRKYKFIYNM